MHLGPCWEVALYTMFFGATRCVSLLFQSINDTVNLTTPFDAALPQSADLNRHGAADLLSKVLYELQQLIQFRQVLITYCFSSYYLLVTNYWYSCRWEGN